MRLPFTKATLNPKSSSAYIAPIPMTTGVRILSRKHAVPMVTADVTIEGTAIVNSLDEDLV